MFYFIFAFVGFACGALATIVALDAKRKRLERIRADNLAHVAEHKKRVDELHLERQQLSREFQTRVEKLDLERQQFAEEMQRVRQSLTQQLQERIDKISIYEAGLKEQAGKLSDASKQFEARVIAYGELENENDILKRDLRNLAIGMRKLELDTSLQKQSQAQLTKKVEEIAGRYLAESVKWIAKSLNSNNFASCKQRLLDVIERCRGIGFEISKEEEQSYIAELKSEYEKEVRAAIEREEQARIKAQIREEQKVEREIQREQERIAREKAIVEAALAKALASAADQHSAEIEGLKARLAEAEANERAISQAQLTKAGFVYVISNIGSFGDDVFKVGMTRRLEPLDRIRELGDASVPFPFDVHMMISCNNAPTLENALHKALIKNQLNKTNPRKEFFRTDIETIVRLVKENHGEVEYMADPEALQYRQSLSMSDEDLQFIEDVYDEVDSDGEVLEDMSEPVKSPTEIGAS